MSELVIPKPTLWFPRYACPQRPHGILPPSPPSEQRAKWRREILRAVRSYAGRMPEGWHFSRIGTPGAMEGGMQSLTGVETGLYGPNFPANPVAGYKDWWKADAGVYKDAGTTPAVNGDSVQQWNNQNGAGNGNLAQSTAGKRPIFRTGELNGLPGIDFDGSDDTLTIGLATLTATCEVWLIAKIDVWGFDQTLFMFGTSGITFVKLDQLFASPNIILDVGGGASTAVGVTIGAYFVARLRSDTSTTSSLTINNGTPVAPAASPAGTKTEVDIASNNNQGATFANCRFVEIVTYASLLSAGNATTNWSYFQGRTALY